jgi:hypothetical protein
MRGKILQTQVLIFENDGRIDLDLCELDVYEIIMQNVGADGVTLFPDGFATTPRRFIVYLYGVQKGL